MKRLHIHIKTDDLEKSVNFYETMFGAAPDKREEDYAKWLLDDPYANISLSTHCGKPGIDHVGISLDSKEELNLIANRLKSANNTLMEESQTNCCYAQSNKFWARDPQGAVWELFQSFGESDHYGAEPDRGILTSSEKLDAPCCEPMAP